MLPKWIADERDEVCSAIGQELSIAVVDVLREQRFDQLADGQKLAVLAGTIRNLSDTLTPAESRYCRFYCAKVLFEQGNAR